MPGTAPNGLVNVKDPSGAVVSISQADLSNALTQGFQEATPEDVNYHFQEQKYGDRPVAAAALGAVKGLTFGLGTQALVKSGAVSPETIQGLEEHNPGASMTGEFGSLLVPGLAEGKALGEAGALVKGVSGIGHAVEAGAKAILPEATTFGGKVLQGAVTKGLGTAAEGAFYGAGQAIHEDALGDPTLNAEKMMSHIGYGALAGGALGAAIGVGSPIFQAGKDFLSSAEALKPTAKVTAPGQPTALSDIAAKVQEGADAGMSPGELPAKAVLKGADSVLSDSKFPVHEVQFASMDDPNARELFKAVKESNSPQGKILRDYESLQKTEGVGMLNDTIDSVAPGQETTADAYKGGEQIIDSARSTIKAARERTSEAFKALKEVAPKLSVSQADILESLGKAMPEAKLSEVVSMGEDGSLEMKKYSPKMSISRDAHDAISDLINESRDGKLTVQDLRNLRKNSVANKISFDMAPETKGEMGSIKKNLMDLMQQKVAEVVPDLKVRDLFKEYAINEQKEDALESIIGGKLDDKASLLRQAKPEQLGDKIFRNSATAQMAKDVLGQATYDRASANWLKEQIAKFTDQGKFSSQRFATWMKSNSTELEIALSDKPETLKRMKALADKMRILPDTAPLNPSGTAKAHDLFTALSSIGGALSHPTEVPGRFLKGLGEKLENRAQIKQINEILAGSAGAEERALRMGKIEKLINKSTQAIQNGASAIFKTIQSAKPAAISISAQELMKSYEKVKDDIDKRATSPHAMVDHLTKTTEPIYSLAPHISGGMQMAMSQATSFLQSKMPDNAPLGSLSPNRVPSPAEVSKFFRYYNVVNDPYIVLDQVKHGNLLPESLEAMSTVYPKLLTEMRVSVVDKLTSQKDHGLTLPYKTKVMLSAFLDKDLIPSISQQALLMNQTSMSAPSVQKDNQQMAEAQQKPSKTGEKSITLANRSNSFTRAVIDRKNSYEA